MSDLISREEVLDLWHLRLSDEEIYKAICDMQPADLLEYARAMKEYCEKHRNEHNFYMCDTCEYASSERAAYAYTYGESHKCPFNVPAYWELPESEDT